MVIGRSLIFTLAALLYSTAATFPFLTDAAVERLLDEEFVEERESDFVSRVVQVETNALLATIESLSRKISLLNKLNCQVWETASGPLPNPLVAAMKENVRGNEGAFLHATAELTSQWGRGAVCEAVRGLLRVGKRKLAEDRLALRQLRGEEFFNLSQGLAPPVVSSALPPPSAAEIADRKFRRSELVHELNRLGALGEKLALVTHFFLARLPETGQLVLTLPELKPIFNQLLAVCKSKSVDFILQFLENLPLEFESADQQFSLRANWPAVLQDFEERVASAKREFASL